MLYLSLAVLQAVIVMIIEKEHREFGFFLFLVIFAPVVAISLIYAGVMELLLDR
jgi:hypothetical protein